MYAINWNNRPIHLRAQVAAVHHLSDTLLWEHTFTPVLEDNAYSQWQDFFDGTQAFIDNGVMLASGAWRITAISGAFNDTGNNVEILLNNRSMYSINTLNASVEFIVPFEETKSLKFAQYMGRFAATLQIECFQRFSENGEAPKVDFSGDQLTVRYQYTPGEGVLTARARIYDLNGNIVATSDDLTLLIAGGSSGGC